MVDHIVVGGGSAGCAIAARLSEDPNTSVLLLEAGPDHRVREARIPAAFPRLFHTERDWDYRTVPQPELDGRSLYWPRGHMLGGSSSMNAMMWVRGNPADYDAWVEYGGQTWSYDSVLPYFRRVENVERSDGGRHTGQDGPVRVAEPRDVNPATALFVEACVNAGIPRNPNANSGRNDGVDVTQVTQHRGLRVSAATAYLEPALARPNLTVLTDALATRVIVERGRAVGVEHLRDGRSQRTRVTGEVILAGGAVNSPQLLMLSGIGDADHRPAGSRPEPHGSSRVGCDSGDQSTRQSVLCRYAA